MSYLSLTIIMVAACFCAGLEAQASKTMNCDGVPFKSIKELRSEPRFENLRKRAGTLDTVSNLDNIQIYVCNIVARPAIWVAFLNSKIDMLYEAVLQEINAHSGSRQVEVTWSALDELLSRQEVKYLILTGFADVYSRLNLQKNAVLKNNDEIVEYTCRQLYTGFGPFFNEFEAMERITKNDQLINKLADYDENLRRLIVVHKTCQTVKF